MFAIIEKNENGDIDYPNFERSISKFFEDYRTFNENQLKKNALWKFPKNKFLKSSTGFSVGKCWLFNNCVHFFRLRVASMFGRRLTRTEKQLQSDSQDSKISRVNYQWSENPVERSHHVTSGQFPVLSDVENLILKKFYCNKRFAIKFQGIV